MRVEGIKKGCCGPRRLATAVSVTSIGLTGQNKALGLPEPHENWAHGGQRTGYPTETVALGACRWGAKTNREQGRNTQPLSSPPSGLLVPTIGLT